VMSNCLLMCLCVCLSEIISSELHVQSSPNFFVCVICGHGSFLLWWHSNTLRTSCFKDDIVFAHKLRLLELIARLRQ